MPILTALDHTFFKENGYVVIPNAVPKENLDAVVEAIWEFLGMDRNNQTDWYREPHRTSGMVELYQHQALWDNRQHPRVYQAFAEILGTEHLWVSMDRACMKPPRHPDHPEYDHKGFIHWDMDTSKPPASLRVQGVLYLTNTGENQGGFQCVPELYRDFPQWVKTQPADRNPRQPDLTGYKIKPIPGQAGDLLIWNTLLPHGNGHNISNKPRFAQYITMSPARSDQKASETRIDMWRNRLNPSGNAFPGDPRKFEALRGKTAKLTPLGRKLLGLDPWEEAV